MVKTVSLPKPAPDLLLLHIELKWITPTIWRRFVVPESITLGKLHHVIQVVMGWSDSHLHEFEIAGEKYGFAPGSSVVAAPGRVVHHSVVVINITVCLSLIVGRNGVLSFRGSFTGLVTACLANQAVTTCSSCSVGTAKPSLFMGPCRAGAAHLLGGSGLHPPV